MHLKDYCALATSANGTPIARTYGQNEIINNIIKHNKTPSYTFWKKPLNQQIKKFSCYVAVKEGICFGLNRELQKILQNWNDSETAAKMFCLEQANPEETFIHRLLAYQASEETDIFANSPLDKNAIIQKLTGLSFMSERDFSQINSAEDISSTEYISYLYQASAQIKPGDMLAIILVLGDDNHEVTIHKGRDNKLVFYDSNTCPVIFSHPADLINFISLYFPQLTERLCHIDNLTSIDIEINYYSPNFNEIYQVFTEIMVNIKRLLEEKELEIRENTQQELKYIYKIISAFHQGKNYIIGATTTGEKIIKKYAKTLFQQLNILIGEFNKIESEETASLANKLTALAPIIPGIFLSEDHELLGPQIDEDTESEDEPLAEDHEADDKSRKQYSATIVQMPASTVEVEESFEELHDQGRLNQMAKNPFSIN